MKLLNPEHLFGLDEEIDHDSRLPHVRSLDMEVGCNCIAL